MAYTESGITKITIAEFDGNVIIRAVNSNADKVVQCYVGGDLVDWQKTVSTSVRFEIPAPDETDLIFLLAVDVGEGHVNYWTVAFPGSGTIANFADISIPQTLVPYRPDDQLVIYFGGAGDLVADTEVYRQPFYPGGLYSGGWGYYWGGGGWGYDGFDRPGWGDKWGVGEWGYGCKYLTYRHGPLSAGTYPVKIAVVDRAGNESAGYDTTVTIAGYPRPASNLQVVSYDKNNDILTLSFTPSPDI